jgi:hypothetical protein
MEDKVEISNFEQISSSFVLNIECLRSIAPDFMKQMTDTQINIVKEIDEFIEKYGFIIENNEGSIKFTLPIEKSIEFNKLGRKMKNLIKATELIPRGFIISLICNYDTLVSSILHEIIIKTPDYFLSSDKTISYEEFMKFASFEDAKEYIIAKEIDTIMRDSHSKQIFSLLKKIKYSYNIDDVLLHNFIELTERRNIYVHCDGKISHQYLNICKDNNVDIDTNQKIGTFLYTSKKYFSDSCDCIFEIGIKLLQICWRKLLGNEIEFADVDLNNVCFELIRNEQYKLALNLLDFATTQIKQHHSEGMTLVLLINKVQTLKWLNDPKYMEIIKSVDWDAKDDKFKLAKYVLTDDFAAAANLMKKIGSDDEYLTKIAYTKEWPLFKEFRLSIEFQNAYKEIFKEDFVFTASIKL